MAQLLQLPPELLTEILATISLSDLLSASVTCKRFYQLIHASIPLQYRLALLSTGHTDNLSSQCALVTADRVFCLREMEKAWRVAHVARVVRIPAPPEGPSGIYDLTGGVYFLGERGGTRTQAMRWVRLPSKDDPEDVEAPVWQRAEVGEDIVDIGVNVRELDLLAVVTEKIDTETIGPESTQTLSIHLLQLSTGRPHPLANQPILRILTAPLRAGHASIALEVVGRALFFLVTFRPMPGGGRADDQLYAVDWVRGMKVAHKDARCGTYAGVAMLAHDAFLLPNMVEGTLELYRLPASLCSPHSEHGTSTTKEMETDGTSIHNGEDEVLSTFELVRVLALPELASGVRIVSANCRSEPNPTSPRSISHIAPPDKRPFVEDPADAVVLVTMVLADGSTDGWVPDFGQFEFVVHRSVLLGMMPPRTHPEDEVQTDEGHAKGEEDLGDGQDVVGEEDEDALAVPPGGFKGKGKQMATNDKDTHPSLSLKANETQSIHHDVGAPDSDDGHPCLPGAYASAPLTTVGSPHSSRGSLPSMRASSAGSRSRSPSPTRSASPTHTRSSRSSHRTHSSVSSMPSLGTTSDSSSSRGDDELLPLPWRTWGPSNTRWLALDEAQSNWITTTSGQRHALLEDMVGGDEGRERRLRVLDFNRHRAAKAMTTLRRQREEDKDTHSAEEANREFFSGEGFTRIPGGLDAQDDDGDDLPALEPIGQPSTSFSQPLHPADDPVWSAADDPMYENADESEVLDERAVGALEDADDWIDEGSDGSMFNGDGVNGVGGPALFGGLMMTDEFDEWYTATPVDVDDAPLPLPLLGALGSSPNGGDESGTEVRFVHAQGVLMCNFFVDDVYSELPYFEARTRERYTYESVLMDEERVVGLVTREDDDDVIALDVLQIG